MAVKFGQGLMMLVIAASMFAVSMGNKDWSSGFNYTDWWSKYGNHHNNKTQQQQPKQILVGGSEHWHFGYNYSDWAVKSGPFYVNDALGELYMFIYMKKYNTMFAVVFLRRLIFLKSLSSHQWFYIISNGYIN
jgi:hypothetical protein